MSARNHNFAPSNSRHSNRLPSAAAVLLISAIGFVIRFYHLGFESLWMDELRQVSYYTGDLRQLIKGAISQTQPPLDYLIGWGLQQLGLSSDVCVRAPALFWGVGSVTLLTWWMTRMRGLAAGAIAGVLLAITPLHVAMSQEARPYTIFTFFMILTTILFVEARHTNQFRWWFAFATATLTMLLTRWVGPFVVIGLFGLYGLVKWVAAEGFEQKKKQIGLLHKTIIAICVPLSLTAPLYGVIYIRNSKYVATDVALQLFRLPAHATDLLGDALNATFTLVWPAVLCTLLYLLVTCILQHAQAGVFGLQTGDKNHGAGQKGKYRWQTPVRFGGCTFLAVLLIVNEWILGLLFSDTGSFKDTNLLWSIRILDGGLFVGGVLAVLQPHRSARIRNIFSVHHYDGTRTFLFVFGCFPIAYSFMYGVFADSSSSKPQYLLPITVLFAAVAATTLSTLWQRYLPHRTIPGIALGLLVVAISVPMLRVTVTQLETKQKRDWAGACSIIRSHGDGASASFLSATPSPSGWNAPFYGLRRYLGISRGPPVYNVLDKVAHNSIRTGTIYVVLYGKYLGYPEEDWGILQAAELPPTTQEYNLTGITLYRVPGPEGSSEKRLSKILSFLAQITKGRGPQMLWKTVAWIEARNGNLNKGKDAYKKALAVCTTDKAEERFLKKTERLRKKLNFRKPDRL